MLKLPVVRKMRNALLSLIVIIGAPHARIALADPAPQASTSEAFPTGLPPISASRTPAKPAEITFGAYLFNSSVLSRDGTLACASCHVAQDGYSGSTPRAIGIGGAIGRRRVPPLFNTYFENALTWDGRASGLRDQIPIPLEAANEMDVDWPKALGDLRDSDEALAFLRATGKHDLARGAVIDALAAYVRTLVSGSSAFDRYYYSNDEAAISDDAKAGLRVFVRKARCSSCHLLTGLSAPLTDGSFHSVGIGWRDGKYGDDGRFAVTHRPEDRGLFKTPTLRNVSQRPYLMHDGSMTSLRQVIDYYDRGGTPAASNFDKRLKPLFLTEDDIGKLIAFLKTLDAPIVSFTPQSGGGP